MIFCVVFYAVLMGVMGYYGGCYILDPDFGSDFTGVWYAFDMCAVIVFGVLLIHMGFLSERDWLFSFFGGCSTGVLLSLVVMICSGKKPCIKVREIEK